MPHMSLQSLTLFGHGVEVFSIILLPRGLHSPKSGTDIAPADIRREIATSKMMFRARGKPELPLLTDIDFHPRP